MSARICICSSQVPFTWGGAELLATSLGEQLEMRGFEVAQVALPFAWHSRGEILKSALAWRLLDLTQVDGERVDLVIATKFPSYMVRHPNKVVWLIHQFRQAYELKGTPYSDFAETPDDQETVAMIRAMDRRCLSEARRLCTISGNTARRLETYLGLEGEALYPPPAIAASLRQGEFGDYVFSVGRLDEMKRFDLLLRAVAESSGGVRCVLAGDGPERSNLEKLAADLGIVDRVEFAGQVTDERLVDLYAGSLAVFYAPFDEDYGYVTVEAFMAGKPVVTTDDSGGVLEFVSDDRTGLVAAGGSPRRLGQALDRLAGDRQLAARLGQAGRHSVDEIGWDRVIDVLTSTL
jgi:glycosyltransferase involved in cell wall biosynthesis